MATRPTKKDFIKKVKELIAVADDMTNVMELVPAIETNYNTDIKNKTVTNSYLQNCIASLQVDIKKAAEQIEWETDRFTDTTLKRLRDLKVKIPEISKEVKETKEEPKQKTETTKKQTPVSEACALYIDQEIESGIKEGKTAYAIGKDLSKWIAKLFQARIKPNTIEKRAQRKREEYGQMSVNNQTSEQKQDVKNLEDHPTKQETENDSQENKEKKEKRGGKREGAGRKPNYNWPIAAADAYLRLQEQLPTLNDYTNEIEKQYDSHTQTDQNYDEAAKTADLFHEFLTYLNNHSVTINF